MLTFGIVAALAALLSIGGPLAVLQLPDGIIHETTPLNTALVAAIVLVGGYISSYITDGIKTYSNWVDRQSPIVKKVISFVVALGVGYLFSAMSQSVNPIIGALFTVLVNAGVFRKEKREAAALAGISNASVSVNQQPGV